MGNIQEDIGMEALKKLHLTLSIGVIMLISVIYYLMMDRDTVFTLGGEFGEIIVLTIVIACLGGVYVIKNKNLDAIQSLHDPEEKWNKYRKLQIFKFALVEIAAILCVVWYFVSANLVLLLIGLALSFLLFIMKPSRDKFFAEAIIQESDQNMF
jgi:hypothetical protein